MRGRNERTLATNDGFVTEVYATSINFIDGKGNWQPIDDTLVAAGVQGFSHKNKANGYTVLLPDSLSRPIRFSVPAGSVDIQLAGAAGRISSAGSTASYSDAFTDTAVAYDAEPDSLKETLSLSTALAPTTFSYDLTLPKGWLARQNARGSIDIVDAKNGVEAELLRPFMYDAAHAVAPSTAVTLAPSLAVRIRKPSMALEPLTSF